MVQGLLLSGRSGEWRNWQTRRIQVPVSERMWGFKSPLAHPPTTHTHPPTHPGSRQNWIFRSRRAVQPLTVRLGGISGVHRLPGPGSASVTFSPEPATDPRGRRSMVGRRSFSMEIGRVDRLFNVVVDDLEKHLDGLRIEVSRRVCNPRCYQGCPNVHVRRSRWQHNQPHRRLPRRVLTGPCLRSGGRGHPNAGGVTRCGYPNYEMRCPSARH